MTDTTPTLYLLGFGRPKKLPQQSKGGGTRSIGGAPRGGPRPASPEPEDKTKVLGAEDLSKFITGTGRWVLRHTVTGAIVPIVRRNLQYGQDNAAMRKNADLEQILLKNLNGRDPCYTDIYWASNITLAIDPQQPVQSGSYDLVLWNVEEEYFESTNQGRWVMWLLLTEEQLRALRPAFMRKIDFTNVVEAMKDGSSGADHNAISDGDKFGLCGFSEEDLTFGDHPNDDYKIQYTIFSENNRPMQSFRVTEQVGTRVGDNTVRVHLEAGFNSSGEAVKWSYATCTAVGNDLAKQGSLAVVPVMLVNADKEPEEGKKVTAYFDQPFDAEKQDNRDECCVCMDEKANRLFKCGHGVCDICLPQINDTCPTCRKGIAQGSTISLQAERRPSKTAKLTQQERDKIDDELDAIFFESPPMPASNGAAAGPSAVISHDDDRKMRNDDASFSSQSRQEMLDEDDELDRLMFGPPDQATTPTKPSKKDQKMLDRFYAKLLLAKPDVNIDNLEHDGFLWMLKSGSSEDSIIATFAQNYPHP